MPAEVVLEPGEAGRRVDGERDPARELDAEKAPEVVDAGRKHDCDGPAGGEPVPDEPGGDAARAVEERAVGDHRLRFGLVDETDVLALRMLRGVPREGVDQGLGVCGNRIRFGLHGGFRGRRRRTFAHDDPGPRQVRGHSRTRS